MLIHGVGVGRNAVVGPVARAHPVPVVLANVPAPLDPESAVSALTEVIGEVSASLRARADAASGTLKEVLSATAMMAADPALAKGAAAKVRSGVAPARAVWDTAESFIDMFKAAGGYMADRATDLASVRDRIVARLLGLPEPGVPALDRASVIVAEDLSPADTAVLDLDLVLGLVIERGGPTSHTAIIAGQLGLPCIVRATAASDLHDRDVVAVDAARGTVTVGPDEETITAVSMRRQALESLNSDSGPGGTSDGHGVQLLANIGTAEDADRLSSSAAEGVGLFRTEVLFLDSTTAPTLEEQAGTYARALDALGDRKVVFRTLDAGADKPLAFVNQLDEENPALGIRAYRLVRTVPELLEVQLAAIAAATERTGGSPWVMAPMIATVEEARDFAAAARAAGIGRVGVMVEIPAVALRARDVLAEVDFVSIGTNDLAQYTMAADRLRGELADLLNIWQPAVLDLVASTADAGAELDKPVGVCGESAGDPVMALALVGMGVTSLSMSPASLPGVRYALRRHTQERCREIALAALSARTASEARAAALALVDREVRDTLALD